MTLDPTSNPPPPMPPDADRFDEHDRWERRRMRREHRHHHHHGRFHGHLHGVVPGLVVIAWGGLLLLRELGMISSEVRALDLWPLVLIGFGVGALVQWRSVWSAIVGLGVGLFGADLLAERLGHPMVGFARLWPIAIVAAGVAIVLRGFGHQRRHRGPQDETVSADELRRSITMGGLSLVVDSQRFKGGDLSATMAEVKIDLRRAALEGDEATLDFALVMSGVELRVPPSWQIVNDVSPMMGTVEDQTELRPDAAGVQRRLVLRGNVTMGAVTVKN